MQTVDKMSIGRVTRLTAILTSAKASSKCLSSLLFFAVLELAYRRPLEMLCLATMIAILSLDIS